MTVVIPIAGFNRSGGVKTLVLLANAMAARGWRVRIIAPDFAAESPFAIDPRVVVSTLWTPSLPDWLRKFAYYARLAFSALRADLCLANFYPTVYCALLSRVLSPRTRVVYFVQGDEAESHGRLAEAGPFSRVLRYGLARLSYRLPVRIICVSEWLRRRIGRPDGTVIMQGLDLQTFRPVDRSTERSAVVIGTIGAPAESKGYPDFCRALDLLPAPNGISVIVAGYEPVPLPASRVAAERITAGTEAEMAAFYHRCDIFVFASRSEGFGLPPLEAMACGCAVVTTDCGGVSDFARQEENCLLVPPADSTALAAAIRRLAEDGRLRTQLASAGVATARELDRARMMAQFLEAIAA
jgi:glycosyltransferase involved in cell wall biosynthesis